LMIVVAIVAILAAIAMPAYKTYTLRAKFSEVVAAAGPAKTAIDTCVLTYRGTAVLNDCIAAGTAGKSQDATGLVTSITVAEDATTTGAIAITVQGDNDPFTTAAGVYVLRTTAAVATGTAPHWTDEGSACIKANLC